MGVREREREREKTKDLLLCAKRSNSLEHNQEESMPL